MEIQLIGELRVVENGEPQSLPSSRKTRALLAYLVLNPDPTSRERLCELFWQVPDDPRGSLRWSLSKLRGLVDDAGTKRIVANRETVAFVPAGARIDIHQFRNTLEALEDQPTDALEQLARLASLGFLRGLDLNGQPEFEHFLAAEREIFRRDRKRLLEALVARLSDEDPARAIRWLQELVDLEPYDEQMHLALLEALAQAGRKEDAQRQLKTSRSTLAEVDGVDVAALARAAGGRPQRAAKGAPSSETEAAATPPAQQVRFCKAADGTQIAYATVGEGPPLVKTANWLNHLEFDWESPVWRHFFRALSSDRTLVRYDARGNGLSDWEVDDFTLERQVADLEAVVAASGYENFPLLALSQGCAVSVVFAARHPEKVSKLILIGGYARGFNRVGNPEVIRQVEAMTTLVGIGWGQDNPAFRQMFTSMFMPDAPPENHAWFNELQRATTTPQNATALLRANADVDVTDVLAEVRTPTLVMHARNDMRIPYNSGRELAGGIPGARFVTLDTRNHLMHEADPAWATARQEIARFLAD
ncbi:MAG: alpha/beta hydrolase [Gammaproteobacteria bacterium]|nr:MAG: alpha/beta hydrolase [Gammaproteobacteria bacterium]